MTKQILCQEIKEYLKSNPKCVLLDVRTEEEWNQDGKPDGEKIGLKTYFLTIQNENFVSEFKKLNIEQDHEILTMCMSGVRSQMAAELLSKENLLVQIFRMVFWEMMKMLVGKIMDCPVVKKIIQSKLFYKIF